MNLSERWNHILVALSVREDSAPAQIKLHKDHVDSVLMQCAQWKWDMEFAQSEKVVAESDRKSAQRLMEVARKAELELREELRQARSGEGRAGIVQIIQHSDQIGELTVLCRDPKGELVTLNFDTSKPRTCPVPEGFRVVQIGAISPNVLFENPSSPGTLVANAFRRFNDNVMRFENFKGIVRDEGMIQDGNDLGTSTVLLEFGKRAYEIVVTSREAGSISVPDGAIANPALPKGREEIHPLDLRAKAMGKKPN